MSTKGPMLAPDALKPATTTPSRVIGMPPAPGKFASGEQATKPVAIGAGSVRIRLWCTVLGTCWVAAIHAFERARAIPPAPPRSMREAVMSTPLAPTTAIPPRAPMWSALAIARSISGRASAKGSSFVCITNYCIQLSHGAPATVHAARPRDAAHTAGASVGAGEAEDLGGDEARDQVVVDGRDLVQARLAELALDVVFVDEAVAAVGVEADVGRRPARLGAQELGHIGLGAAGLPGVEATRGLVAHQVGRAHLHVRLGDGELHALISADRAAEDLARVGVGGRALGEPVTVADRLGGEQDALGVPAVDHVAETLALLADHARRGHPQPVIADPVGGVVEHRPHRRDLELPGVDLPQVDQEQAEALRAGLRRARAG